MKIKRFIILMLLGISLHASAWRIEDDILYLEKGDNIWQVAYSLTGNGQNWKELWATRIDNSITNPFHAYPNMKFKLKKGLFNLNVLKSVDIDSSLARETIIDLSKPKEKTKQEQPVKKNEILGMEYSFGRIMIPVSVTLIVFLLGHFISWIKSKKERLNELNSVKVTIVYWISLIKPIIQKQIDNYKEFIDNLENSSELHPERLAYSPFLVDKLQKLELKELIEMIIVNLEGDEDKKSKMIFNLISQIEYLSKMEKIIMDNHEKFKSYTLELMNDWNSEFLEFNNELNESSKQISIKDPQSSFLSSKDDICNKFLENRNPRPINELFTDLINPLETIMVVFLKESPNKDLALNLGYSIDKLKIIKRKWDTHKGGHIQIAKDFNGGILNSYNKLELVGTQLGESKFKNIMSIK